MIFSFALTALFSFKKWLILGRKRLRLWPRDRERDKNRNVKRLRYGTVSYGIWDDFGAPPLKFLTK